MSKHFKQCRMLVKHGLKEQNIKDTEQTSLI